LPTPATVPDAPTSLARDSANTNKTQVAITWSPGASNGGTVVIDYSVYWDQGTNNYVLAASGVTTTSYTKTTGITAGTTYKFKVKARNAIGLSADSAEFSIVAATVPSAPNAPATSVSSDTLYMTVTWSAPSDNGGLAVTGYKVYVRASDITSWYQDLVHCDAATDSSIITNRSCTIPTETLRASPFSLTTGTSIYAKVIAINAIGDSNSSA
jgi:hypothetical protein